MSKPTSSISSMRRFRLTKMRRLLGTSVFAASGPRRRAISLGKSSDLARLADLADIESFHSIIRAAQDGRLPHEFRALANRAARVRGDGLVRRAADTRGRRGGARPP